MIRFLKLFLSSILNLSSKFPIFRSYQLFVMNTEPQSSVMCIYHASYMKKRNKEIIYYTVDIKNPKHPREAG